MIALVFVFSDFSLGYTDIGVPILVGNYRDFDTEWYNTVGAKISFSMVTNSIAPFFAKFFEPILTGALRYLDRGFKKHLRKVSNVIEEKQAEYEKEKEERKKNPGKKKETPKKEGGEAEVAYDGGSEDEVESPAGDDYGEEEEDEPKLANEGHEDGHVEHEEHMDLDEPETGKIF